MKYVYVIYEHPYANVSKPICLVSSKKKAVEYCSTEGRKLINKNKNQYGRSNGYGYYSNVLSFQKVEVL